MGREQKVHMLKFLLIFIAHLTIGIRERCIHSQEVDKIIATGTIAIGHTWSIHFSHQNVS